jgi:N-formylglutamate deformylase
MAKKLILHIPHSADGIPDKTGYVVSDAVLNDEILLLTDWFTDDLFSTSDCVSVVANFNRVFCDVERFADDDKEAMAAVGMGTIYTNSDYGSILRNVSDELKNSILENYYYPHHKKLSAAVAEQLASDGKALIVDCHSFSSTPFKRDLSQDTPRPDICIGTDSFHTPRSLYKFSAVYFKWHGYSVKVNNPYSGSIVPMEYYQKNSCVHTIMIEVNRDLYLNPGTNQMSEGYNKIKSVIQDYLKRLSHLNYDFGSEPITEEAFKLKNSKP